jgi:hypothetical protein
MGDTQVLEEYDDVQPLNVDAYIQQSLSSLGKTELFISSGDIQQATNSYPEEIKLSHQDERQSRPRPIAPRTRSNKRKAESYTEGDLRANVTNSAQAGITADESLRQSGYIEHANEYIDRKDIV